MAFKMKGFDPGGGTGLHMMTKKEKRVKKPKLDIKGYLKGEQGFIPDWKGESTKTTIKKLINKAEGSFGGAKTDQGKALIKKTIERKKIEKDKNND
jgi:hypothetical protein